MIRALALTIVVTLAAVPAGLLCLESCVDIAPQGAAADSCHHANPSTGASLTGSDTCQRPPGLTVFVREEAWRVATNSDRHAVFPVRYRFTNPPIDTASFHTAQPEWSSDKRPLTIALRI